MTVMARCVHGYSCGTNAMERNNHFLIRFKEETHAWCCKSDEIFFVLKKITNYVIPVLLEPEKMLHQ